MGLSVLLSVPIASVFAAAYWLGSTALFNTIDRSILEQLQLLSERPPEMLVFMISSRMKHEPAVITHVGLFDTEQHPIVGDITTVPPGIRIDGSINVLETPREADEGANVLHLAGRQLKDGRLLLVAQDVASALSVQATLRWTLIGGLLAAVMISFGFGIVFGVRADLRLRRLNSVAERIAGGSIQERLPVRGQGDELDALCVMVNRVLDRLEELVIAWKNVGEDVAHDLRTPLTAVRMRLERARQEGLLDERASAVIDRAIAGIDQVLSIVTALLRIAEIDNRYRQEFRPFDLAKVLAETAENFMPLAEEAGVELSLRAKDPTVIVGDRALLTEAIFNLVDNAIKFAGRGHHVMLELHGSPQHPTIAVSDDGPGIPAEDRPRVFRRFYRRDASRSTAGSGLGLSLVAAVARLHGFKIRLSDNEPGSRFELDCWTTAQHRQESIG